MPTQITVGDRVPNVTVRKVTNDGIEEIATADLFQGAKVVLFGVPGAFTPTCSETHFPGFLVASEDIAATGVDVLACMAVNDHFVMNAWSKTFNNGDHGLVMIADGSAFLTERLGLELDGSSFGMGRRCRRFALIVDDGIVTYVGVESGPEVGVSSAEAVMAKLTTST